MIDFKKVKLFPAHILEEARSGALLRLTPHAMRRYKTHFTRRAWPRRHAQTTPQQRHYAIGFGDGFEA